jgi:hypothetical protein
LIRPERLSLPILTRHLRLARLFGCPGWKLPLRRLQKAGLLGSADVADAKTRSKWSRVLRFARNAKPADQRLTNVTEASFSTGTRQIAFDRRTVLAQHMQT